MLLDYKLGQGSIVLRVKIRNSSVSTGAGLTGLTSASSGLIISTIADNEATATTYTVAGSTIESITTLGTYAAPTATKCRFKEVDSTNHPGIYEIQIADARFAITSAKSMLISISGATNAAQCDVLVPLRSVDPYSASAFITGVNSLAPPSNWNSLNVTNLNTLSGHDPGATLASQTNITGGTITTVTNLTNAPTAGDFTSTMKTSLNNATPAVTVSDKTGFSLSSAGIQAIWDALSSALTTVGSIGKRLVDYLTGDIFARLGSPAGASVSADIAGVQSDTNDIQTRLPAALDANGYMMSDVEDWKGATAPAMTGDAYARLGAPVGASISADIAGVPAALLDLSSGVETSLTLRQAMRLLVAANAGKLSGAATTTITIRDTADAKNRIVATVDSSGNRSALTYDLT